MVVISYGNKSDAEIKLVLSSVTFAWLIRCDRILQLPQPCSPVQLFEFICQHEQEWQSLLALAGLSSAEVEELRVLNAAAKEGTNGQNH